MLAGRGRGKVRAPRRGMTKEDAEFDADAKWEVLAGAFRDIHTKNASKLSYEQLFRNAYQLVIKKKGDMLYDNVAESEEVWLKTEVRTNITHLITPAMTMDTGGPSEGISMDRKAAGERFMRAIQSACKDHQLAMSLITDVLMYMDRIQRQEGRRPSIFATSMALFRIHVLQTPFKEGSEQRVLDLLEAIILDMIQIERKGQLIDRSLVRACCSMLESLYETFTEEESSKLYLTSFEPKFLEASQQHYRDEGQALLAEADASTFCSHARRRLKEEDERCRTSISQITEPKIRAVVEKELISAHIEAVINLEGTGVKNMIDNDRVQDLTNVYDLVARVDPRKMALKKAVQRRVVEMGHEINKNASNSDERTLKPAAKPDKSENDKTGGEKPVIQQTSSAIVWVEDVLKLKATFDKMWEQAFRKDQAMEKALEVSFQDFINANSRSSEHISLFFNEYLTRGGKGKTEAEVDQILDNGITLLQYLGDKDMFETYYKKHMAKRLLLKKSISRDMERQVLSKMKAKMGNQFTQKMDGLIRDMELSENLNQQYKDHINKLGSKDTKQIDVEASVLTTNVWPFEGLLKPNEDDSNRRDCKYPDPIERVRTSYQKFYLDKHTGRKLTWLANMGTADLRAHFKGANGKSRRYEVNVSTYAMVILMLFNDLPVGESLSFEEIEAETNISRNDLVRNLQSLSLSPKWRLLKKDPMSKEISLKDRFFFNEEYTSQFLKIKVQVVSQTSNRIESNEERKETQRKADEERGHAIEAAVVRIMKARKNLSHQALMNETLSQLSTRFQPDVNMIKKKIEALIDREYLERGQDGQSYIYLA